MCPSSSFVRQSCLSRSSSVSNVWRSSITILIPLYTSISEVDPQQAKQQWAIRAIQISLKMYEKYDMMHSCIPTSHAPRHVTFKTCLQELTSIPLLKKSWCCKALKHVVWRCKWCIQPQWTLNKLRMWHSSTPLWCHACLFVCTAAQIISQVPCPK